MRHASATPACLKPPTFPPTLPPQRAQHVKRPSFRLSPPLLPSLAISPSPTFQAVARSPPVALIAIIAATSPSPASRPGPLSPVSANAAQPVALQIDFTAALYPLSRVPFTPNAAVFFLFYIAVTQGSPCISLIHSVPPLKSLICSRRDATRRARCCKYSLTRCHRSSSGDDGPLIFTCYDSFLCLSPLPSPYLLHTHALGRSQ